MKAYHWSISLGINTIAVCVISYVSPSVTAFSTVTRQRRFLGGRSASASASAPALACARRSGNLLGYHCRDKGENSARHILNLFDGGHSAEARAADSSHQSARDAWSAASSHAKCHTCNDDSDVLLLRQEGTKNASNASKSATSFSELILTILMLMAVTFFNPAMSSLALAADDVAAAPNGGSAPPPAATITAPTTAANSGYDAVAAMGMGMDWNGSGAGGSMQWVPDPVLPPSPSTEKGTSSGDAKVTRNSNGEETGTNGPSADTTMPSNNEAAQETRHTGDTETAEPTIDEYGLEITETDTRNSQAKQESSKSSSSSGSNEQAADHANNANGLNAGISNEHDTADASNKMTDASIANSSPKPFDYQAAADDLFATTPSTPSTTAETSKLETSKTFDDSQYAMDKDDKEVVDGLGFKLYDGRNK